MKALGIARRRGFASFARLVATFALGAAALGASIDYRAERQAWTLQSGTVVYRLTQRNGLVLVGYFGPAGQPDWPAARYDIAGMVEQQRLLPAELTLVKHDVQPDPDHARLRLTYRHKRIPLEIDAVYTAWGDTGVFTRQLTLRNVGERPLAMESTPSLAWRLPPGEYTLDYLRGHWGEERQLESESLGPGRRAFVNTTGRSTSGYSPWFSVRSAALGVRFAAQLAYSGNWEMGFDRLADRRVERWSEHDLKADLGMRFDFGAPAPLPAGGAVVLPAVAFTASAGDLDDVANQLHRYQVRYVVPRSPVNEPPLAQFNSWYPLGRRPKADDLNRYADAAAALGLEVFVIDSGWFSNRGQRVDPIFGDWEADPVTFPRGLRDVADHVHGRGMKFGVWVEIECAAVESRVVREHPDWVLTYNGVPRGGSRQRLYLNFGKPEVRRWARAVIDRLVRDDRVDWFKFDYNVDVGDAFDPTGPGRTGTVLYEHLRNYLGFLDEIRTAYPNLIIENCASGGLRFDLALIGHTHTNWISDVVDPRQSVQLAYGATLEFTPAVCNHWMVGDAHDGTVDQTQPPGWWDFMFRIAMNGQFGISSRILDWSPALQQRAAENIALYKRLRAVIAGADVYHLTPPPAAGKSPRGWMALQYAAPAGSRATVLAYRLGQSEPRTVLRLRGLDPARRYTVREEGRACGSFSGDELARDGLAVELPAEWRAAVFELEAAP